MKKIEVLFLSDNFWPEVNAPASRTYEHCRAWVELGADVTVVTCAPNFPTGRTYPGYSNRPYQTDEISGIRVVRVWSYMSANEGFFRRTLDYLSFAATSFLACLIEQCDVIVATSPQFFTTWSGYLLSKIKRRPWVFELRDIWPESIAAVGAAKSRVLLSALERVELSLYRDAARIIAVSPAFKENLTRRGIDGRKIEIVTNGVDFSLSDGEARRNETRASLGLEGKFVIGYLGTHGLAHGLDFVLRSAAQIRDERIRFVFVGDGAEKRSLLTLAADLDAKNVVFLDPVGRQQVSDLLAAFDVALVPLRRTETFLGVIPSKIFEAALMRRPILLGVDGQARELVESYRAGLFFEPEDESSLLQAIDHLANNSAIYAALQEGGSRLAEAYDRRVLAERMLGILEDVAFERNGG